MTPRPTSRSPCGYRRYDLDALARLDLIRTLRDLGVGLATIGRVLDREISVPEVAAAHAEALDVQIHQFIDEAFGDLDANPGLVAMLRSAMPELSDDPTPEQVDAWVELAELVQDPDFKASVRRAAEYQAAERVDGDRSGLHHELTNQIRQRVEAALAGGIDPASERARMVLKDLVGRYAQTFGKADTPEYRSKLLIRLQIANDPRVERYWYLLATINGWPASPALASVFEWFIQALQHHPNP